MDGSNERTDMRLQRCAMPQAALYLARAGGKAGRIGMRLQARGPAAGTGLATMQRPRTMAAVRLRERVPHGTCGRAARHVRAATSVPWRSFRARVRALRTQSSSCELARATAYLRCRLRFVQLFILPKLTPTSAIWLESSNKCMSKLKSQNYLTAPPAT